MTRIAKALVRLATDTEPKHEEVIRDAEYADIRGKYFRFNVEGLGDVDLCAWYALLEIRLKAVEF